MNFNHNLKLEMLVGEETKEAKAVMEPMELEKDAQVVAAKTIPEDEMLSHLDHGYSWVIVFQAFMASVFSDGAKYSFGIFLPLYAKVFGIDIATVAWVGSITSGASTMTSMVAGYSIDRYGNRPVMLFGLTMIAFGFIMASLSTELWHLYLSQGLICGVGFSLAFTSGFTLVGQWFSNSRRGFAVGLSSAGSGIGQFAMVNVTSTLLINEGWRATLQYLAIIEFVGMFCCAMAVKRLQPLIPRTGPSMMSTMHTQFQDRRFALLYLGYVVNIFGYVIPYVHLPTYGLAHGLSTSQANFLLSLVGLMSAFGRITIGYLADRFGKLLMLRVSMLGAGVITFFWILFTTYPWLVFYSCVFGYFAGGIIVLIPSVVAELFGVERLGSVLGLMYTSMTFGFLLAGPAAGWIVDATKDKSYTNAIILSAVCMVAGAVIVDTMCDATSKLHLETLQIHFHHDHQQQQHVQQQQQQQHKQQLQYLHEIWKRIQVYQQQVVDNIFHLGNQQQQQQIMTMVKQFEQHHHHHTISQLFQLEQQQEQQHEQQSEQHVNHHHHHHGHLMESLKKYEEQLVALASKLTTTTATTTTETSIKHPTKHVSFLRILLQPLSICFNNNNNNNNNNNTVPENSDKSVPEISNHNNNNNSAAANNNNNNEEDYSMVGLSSGQADVAQEP